MAAACSAAPGVERLAEDRGSESTLSNLEAEVWKQAMNVPGRPGADIGLQNPGGVRADLRYAPSGTEKPGEVTYAEAAAVAPFANTLVTLDVTGAQLKQTLEEQWQPTSSRPFLHLGTSANVRYTMDASRPLGDRITAIWVDGALVSATDVYRVATNSFLAAGGDGFVTLAKGANMTDSGLVDLDSFVTWLKNAGTVSPSFVKHGVTVSGVSVVRHAGKVAVKASISGMDIPSIGAPHNTTFSAQLGGTTVASVPIKDVVVTGVPTRYGAAEVEIVLPIKELKRLNKDDTLTLVADPSGTVVTFTVKF